MTIIETESGKIDLDKGAINIDGKWFTVDQLKEEIKKKIASDDFDVSNYTSALKDLETELKNFELVSFKAPRNLVDSIKELSGERDKSFENMLIDALTEYLKMQGIEVRTPGGIKKDRIEKEPKSTEEESAGDEEGEADVEFEIDEAEVEFEEFDDEADEKPDRSKEPEKEKEEEVLEETTCPRCGGKVPITSTERPLTIKCPSCGKKGRLVS